MSRHKATTFQILAALVVAGAIILAKRTFGADIDPHLLIAFWWLAFSNCMRRPGERHAGCSTAKC